jgi:hypothetical protein
LADFERLSVNAMNASFHSYADRKRIVTERIEPGFAAIRKSL